MCLFMVGYLMGIKCETLKTIHKNRFWFDGSIVKTYISETVSEMFFEKGKIFNFFYL